MIIFTTIQIISVTMEITSRSSQLREQGNKAYTSKKNSQALKLYTESVRWVRRRRMKKIDKDGIFNLDFLSHFEIMRSFCRFAPYSGAGQGEELCMAYANRSELVLIFTT